VVLLWVAQANLVSAQSQNSNGFTLGAPKGEFPKTDFENSSVDSSEIMSGGPPRDGIPAIDNPLFESIDQSSEWLTPSEPVIAFQLGNTARAYPLQILIYHEIVNDVIEDKPVAVTFCPLCNASIVFDAMVDGTRLDFGTTGRLRKSDMVMYDRQSETWWQQFTGIGIVGKYNGTVLKQLPSQIVSFDVFKNEFPDGEVLSKKTGSLRPYGNNPYRGYDDINSSPFLFRDPVDPRLPPMERVLAVNVDTTTTQWSLVPLTLLKDSPVVQLDDIVVLATTEATSALDKASIAESRLIPAAAAFLASLDDKPITLTVDENGKLTDSETGSEWSALGKALSGPWQGRRLQQVDSGVHFAFAWLAFDPDAKVTGTGVAVGVDNSPLPRFVCFNECRFLYAPNTFKSTN